MLILLPFIIIILIIVAIDHFYYTDAKPHVVPPKEAQHSVREANTTNSYLDKYIKK
jgi:hypothetical protein